MALLLLLVLILLTIIAWIVSKGDIISPWFISCVMFFISSLTAVINMKKWGIDFSAITVITIIIALISFGIGELIFLNGANKRKKVNIDCKSEEIRDAYVVPKEIMIIVIILGAIICVLTYKKAVQIAVLFGYSNSGYMFAYVRNALLYADASWGYGLAIGQYFIVGAAYVFSFIFIYNLIMHKKRDIIYLVPSIYYIINMTLSTSRSGFIKYISVLLFMTIILIKIKSGWKWKVSWKMVSGVIFSAVIFLYLFIQLGQLTGKSSSVNAGDIISIYTGSSIAGLNNFLLNPIPENKLFAEETLFGVYSTLNHFGFNFDVTVGLDFVNFSNGYSTNVYTSLRRYISDYGYWGMIIIQFLISFFCNAFYELIKNRNKVDIWIIIYSYLAYGLVYQSIEEAFLRVSFTIEWMLSLFFIVVFYNIICSRK
ncbi:MAG: O-antigen polymerase [Clostridiaceae bacterium]